MQIEVVDNCSTIDDPEPVVKTIAGDRITFTRNAQNVGLMGNFNRCIERSRGHLIQILHSDDYVEPTFYSAISNLAVRNPDCGFLASRVFVVDETEVIIEVSRRVKWMENPTHDVTPMLQTQYFLFPGVVVRRALYEQCGGFKPGLVYCGDWEMWVRAVHFGGGVAHNQPLANWRLSAGNESARLARLGEDVRDYLRLNGEFSRYPGFSAPVLRDQAAWRALEGYQRFASEGDVAAAQINLKLYRQLVPLPVRAARGALGGLRHIVRRVKRLG